MTGTLSRPLISLVLAMIVGFGLVSAVWLPFSEVDVDPGSLCAVGTAAGTLLGIACVCALIARRLSGDDSRIGRVLRYGAAAAIHIALAGAAIMAATAGMLISNYLMMTTALPLFDARFAALDAALGFDWQAALAVANGSPLVAELLVHAYASSLPQMIALVLILGATLQSRRLLEFVALYLLTGAAVSVLAMLMPAIGPYQYYRPDPALYTHFTNAGRVHLEHLQALRAGTFEILDIENGAGLVTFPSFHTVLAILVPFAFRDMRLLFWPLVLLNAVVVAATLPEGGHYLVDLFGGALVALAAISVVRLLAPEDRSERRAWRLGLPVFR